MRKGGKQGWAEGELVLGFIVYQSPQPVLQGPLDWYGLSELHQTQAKQPALAPPTNQVGRACSFGEGSSLRPRERLEGRSAESSTVTSFTRHWGYECFGPEGWTGGIPQHPLHWMSHLVGNTPRANKSLSSRMLLSLKLGCVEYIFKQ